MAAVDAARRHEADARVAVPGIVPGEERLAVGARVLAAPKRAGKPGRYFSVLNRASEYGLSSET